MLDLKQLKITEKIRMEVERRLDPFEFTLSEYRDEIKDHIVLRMAMELTGTCPKGDQIESTRSVEYKLPRTFWQWLFRKPAKIGRVTVPVTITREIHVCPHIHAPYGKHVMYLEGL